MSLGELTEAEHAAADRALRSSAGPELARAMFAVALGRPVEDELSLRRAIALRWLDENGQPTALGNQVKDPLREFVFWEERGRRLPSEELSPVLARPRFAGKDVLEVGSGGGCNLLSLSGIPHRLVGVEPMPLYRQMSPMLAAMAGLPEPEVVEGWGRELPFDEASFDTVLCYSAHQYMRVDRALTEMARVLRPSGRLIVVGNTFFPFAGESVVRFARDRSLGTLKYDLTAIANTLAYQLRGRRALLPTDAKNTTSTPIYPTRGHLYRAARHAGLVPAIHDQRTLPTGETLFVATRR